MSKESRIVEADFTSVRNYHERAVTDAVRAGAARFEHLAAKGLLPDVACVALNRLPPRYIRHEVDFAFFLTEKERAENERAVTKAVDYAFEFVQARTAMRARD